MSDRSLARFADEEQSTTPTNGAALVGIHLALRFGVFYLILAMLWSTVILILSELFGPIEPLVKSILYSVPDFVIVALFETISNQTGVHVISLVENIGNPVGYGVLLLIFGPTFVFGTFASWNFMYAIRELIPAGPLHPC